VKLFFATVVFVSLALSSRAAEHALSIDKSHSRIEVSVDATFREFTAKLSDYETDILADTATGKITRATLRFKFADLKTGEDKRDEAMLTWENNDQFPEAVFTLTAFDGSNPGKPTARGQLIFHGVARSIALSLTVVTKDQLVYSIDGEANLDVQDFGLPILHRYGFIRVDPTVTVSFHLQGSASGK